VPQAVDGVLLVLSEVPHCKFPPVTTTVSVEAKLLARLLDMLNDSSTTERHYRWIIEIVSNLSRHESTAIAVVEANVPHLVEKLLRSWPTNLRWHIFSMLEHLVSHESTAMAVVRVLPFDLLGTLWWYISLDLHISSEVYKSSSKSVAGNAPIDALAREWEDLVTAKLLHAPHKATAELTFSSLVAGVW
jgi:hypothetical protein